MAVSPDYRPKLRPVEAMPARHGGQDVVALRDGSGMSDRMVIVAAHMLPLLALLDGTRTLREIQVEYVRRSGQLLLSEQFEQIVRELDANLLLEGETFERFAQEQRDEFARLTVRPAAHAGKAYPSDPGLLRDQLRSYFAVAALNNPLSDEDRAQRPAALVAPHIDFARGGPCYAHAYRHLSESTAAPPSLLVILGTAHSAPPSPYILTRKGFATPFGLAETNTAILDALERQWPDAANVYRDELSHRGEHSIEFQVVFAQYALGDRMPPILPILCSLKLENAPHENPETDGFIAALGDVLAERAADACIIAGADLSHIGQRFGDPGPLSSSTMRAAEEGDRSLLGHAERLDADGLWRAAQSDTRSRNVCGLPPIYTMLRLARAREGRLLKYEQALERQTQSMVSFAAMVFR
jgi:AmmeMemoRadiSam system protein B